MPAYAWGMDTATDILKQLKPDEIVARLEEMDAEAKALRVLLRAARQREKSRTRNPKREVLTDER